MNKIINLFRFILN